MSGLRVIVLAALVLGAAALRLGPHPYNFTPITAMALFGGAYFSCRWLAFLAPLAAMLLSDFGLYWLHGNDRLYLPNPVVYATFALIVGIGLWLRSHRRPGPIAMATLASSCLFFLITNFAFWLTVSETLPEEFRYPPTLAGLVQCYWMALPFFGGTLMGDLVYVTVFFGGFALAERWIPALRETPPILQSS